MEFTELFSHLLIDLQSLFRKNNKNLSLSLSQITLLYSIPALGISMSSLSLRLGLDNSTLTRLINVLENRSLVKKRSNPDDKRSTIVRLTQKGEEKVEMIEINLNDFCEDIVGSFSYEEKRDLKDMLNRIHWNLTKNKISDN